MMRSVTAGLGALTILAVTGAMTTSGQTFLGFRSPAQNTSSVTAIQDAPPSAAPTVAAAPKAVTPVPAAPAHPAAVTPAARPAGPAPVARPAAAPAAPAAQAGPPAGGLGPGGMGQIANILLNLPQVLSQTQVHPADPEQGGSPPFVPKRTGPKPASEDDGQRHLPEGH